MELSDIYLRTGRIIEQSNIIEEHLKAIIEAYVMPNKRRNTFFRACVMNNSVVSFASKVKLVIAINRELNLVNIKRDSFHRLLHLRNAFAHTDIIGGVRIDLSKSDTDPDSVMVGLESITSNGEIKFITREAAFDEFQAIFHSVEVISKLCSVNCAPSEACLVRRAGTSSRL